MRACHVLSPLPPSPSQPSSPLPQAHVEVALLAGLHTDLAPAATAKAVRRMAIGDGQGQVGPGSTWRDQGLLAGQEAHTQRQQAQQGSPGQGAGCGLGSRQGVVWTGAHQNRQANRPMCLQRGAWARKARPVVCLMARARAACMHGEGTHASCSALPLHRGCNRRQRELDGRARDSSPAKPSRTHGLDPALLPALTR